jgi:hypothetical protein
VQPLIVLALSVLVLAACSSPEASRVRGGGNGADVRNVRESVEMHAGSQPYWDTPRLVEHGGPTPLAMPRQAPAEPAAVDVRERR